MVARDSTQWERKRVLGLLAAEGITSGPLVEAIKAGGSAPKTDARVCKRARGVASGTVKSPTW